ncbi:hypothetical protein DPMN_093682 [Dreissena polymorpha]|uniref:Uncharacterized protein n=1 Tax=Dreissena polymorpha TaxID=45954 RepID=A0A9D4L5Z8_DREPO|nr:hypothetical protein DPMN_093682 [Dreissena polymorpha]
MGIWFHYIARRGTGAAEDEHGGPGAAMQTKTSRGWPYDNNGSFGSTAGDLKICHKGSAAREEREEDLCILSALLRWKLPPGELPPDFKGGGEGRRTAPLSEFRAENCPPLTCYRCKCLPDLEPGVWSGIFLAGLHLIAMNVQRKILSSGWGLNPRPPEW